MAGVEDETERLARKADENRRWIAERHALIAEDQRRWARQAARRLAYVVETRAGWGLLMGAITFASGMLTEWALR